MFNKARRNGNRVAAISTLIAENTVIRGDVEFSGGLHLEGTVDGSICADGPDAVLTLSRNGRVNGEVRVSNMVVDGTVTGDVFVTERLELAANARIEGNVHYKLLEMTAGAQVNGKMLHQDDAPRRLGAPEIDAGAGVPAVADA
ncbi:MAG: bactofilin family protein [Steroidobacteraceae bacterium]